MASIFASSGIGNMGGKLCTADGKQKSRQADNPAGPLINSEELCLSRFESDLFVLVNLSYWQFDSSHRSISSPLLFLCYLYNEEEFVSIPSGGLYFYGETVAGS